MRQSFVMAFYLIFFFYKPEYFFCVFKNQEILKEPISLIRTAMEDVGFDTTPYTKLKYSLKGKKDAGVSAIIIELPDARIEPECNYVAMTFKDEKIKYFESEMFSDGSFRLCSRNEDGMHMIHIYDINDADDLWEKMLLVIKG